MLPSATRFSIWHNVEINVNAFYVVHRVGHEVRDNPIETFRILPSRIAVIWSFAFPLSGLLQVPLLDAWRLFVQQQQHYNLLIVIYGYDATCSNLAL